MNKLSPLMGLLGFFFGATNKVSGGLSQKATGFVEIMKAPQTHLPASADDYKNRLMTSTWFKVGLGAALYGYVAPYIPVLGSKLPLKGTAKKLGTAVAIGAAAGALIDPTSEELGLSVGATTGLGVNSIHAIAERTAANDPHVMEPFEIKEW